MTQTKKIRLSDYGFTILQLETKPVCNMRCEFCAYPKRKKMSSPLTDDVLMAMDSVDPDDDKLEYVCLSHYNEPLLDSRIFRFITHAKEKGFKTLLITNGLLFYSEKIQNQLSEAEPTYIKISLQTLSEKCFKSRGISYSFEQYIKSIYKFLSLSKNKGCNSEICLDVACNFLTNKKLLMRGSLGLECGDPSVPNSLDEIAKDSIIFLKGLNEYDPDFIFDEKKTTDVLKNASPNYLDQTGIQISDRIKLKIKHFVYGRKLTKFHPVNSGNPCGTRILGVLGDGSVVPCCLSYDGRLVMGNIKNESLYSILNRNKELIRIIKQEGGGKIPRVCKICQGAPTRRGVLFLNTFRKFQKNVLIQGLKKLMPLQ